MLLLHKCPSIDKALNNWFHPFFGIKANHLRNELSVCTDSNEGPIHFTIDYYKKHTAEQYVS